MKPRAWIAGWLAIVLVIAMTLGYWVYRVDPFMHYHKPDTDTYFYTLSGERSQNDGIVKHLDYDALIAGTSMVENSKTSEMDSIFGCTAIKVPFSGGRYKEINDNIRVALKCNPHLKTVVRGLDESYLIFDKNANRTDSGEYPTYLYNDNPFDDVKYLLNRDVIWSRTYQMIISNDNDKFTPGMTSFDSYASWQKNYLFGIDTVLPDGITEYQEGKPIHLTPEEKETIKGNIEQNVTSLAKEYPDVDFYYFITPYSIAWWQIKIVEGSVYHQIEVEQYAIELILETENIKLFSFNNRDDITSNLNNYRDSAHYGTWVNSLMLKWMHEGQYQLTKENYQDYLAKELDNVTSFDYMSLNQQEDYENDFYAAALFNEELTGVAPTAIPVDAMDFELKNATIVENQHDGKAGIKCVGSLQQNEGGKVSVEDALREGNFIGGSTTIDIANENKYLVFYGKKQEEYGHPAVMIFDEDGNLLAEASAEYLDIDEEWHQYLIDVSDLRGTMRVVFSGGYTDGAGAEKATFIFSDICLY